MAAAEPIHCLPHRQRNLGVAATLAALRTIESYVHVKGTARAPCRLQAAPAADIRRVVDSQKWPQCLQIHRALGGDILAGLDGRPDRLLEELTLIRSEALGKDSFQGGRPWMR